MNQVARALPGTVLALLLLAPPAIAADAPSTQPAAPSPPDTWVPRTTADLVLLEKLRAQPSAVTLATGQSTTFGSITVTLKSCATRPPDLPQNSAAFLVVTDSKAGAAPVFSGWVLSNTPAVSQLEHPLYDLRLVTCR